jgi:hypothetical protein
VHGRVIRQLLALLLQAGEALAQAGKAGRKLPLVDEPFGVPLNHPRHPLPHLAELRLDHGQRRALGVGLRRSPASVFRGEPLWVGEPQSDFVPHRALEQSRPHLRMVTDALASTALRVGAQAAVGGIRARRPLAGTRAEALPVIRLATVLALP